MLQKSIIALLLFTLGALIVYYLLPQSKRKYFLLAVSMLFYILCDIKMFAVLLGTLLWTWYCGKKIEGSSRKKWLFIGCLPVVLLLIFFKYNQFFVQSAQRLLGSFGLDVTAEVANILIPLGISYYSFKAISYLSDLSNSNLAHSAKFVDYALYLLLYAEILSGPISRYHDYETILDRGFHGSKENLENGFYLIIKGMFMKAVIANRLSGYVTAVFSAPASYPGLALWLAAFFYAIQLYCDFAGYSFIAVGITQLFGMYQTKNFSRPYFAVNIRDFWDRWHISLSNWLKDYIYIPLGGSRCSKLRNNGNILTVFLISGLWHGSGLNFVVWGLYHAVVNILTGKRKKELKGIKKSGSILLNFCIVTFGWIFFGTKNLSTAWTYIRHMFTDLTLSMNTIQSAILPFTNDNSCVAFFLVALGFILILAIREFYEEKKKLDSCATASSAWQVFLLTMIILFGDFGSAGFIYANF